MMKILRSSRRVFFGSPRCLGSTGRTGRWIRTYLVQPEPRDGGCGTIAPAGRGHRWRTLFLPWTNRGLEMFQERMNGWGSALCLALTGAAVLGGSIDGSLRSRNESQIRDL